MPNSKDPKVDAYLQQVMDKMRDLVREQLENNPVVNDYTRDLASLGVVVCWTTELEIMVMCKPDFVVPQTAREIEFQLPSDEEIHQFFSSGK